MELWITEFSINTVCMWCHKNGGNLDTSKIFKNLKPSDGRRVQFLHRMALHANHPRQLHFCTYWLQRDGPVPYWSVFSKKSLLFDKTFHKVKFTVSSYFYLTKKLLVLCVGLLYLKNCSDKARRVVHLSPCCRFHASLCTIRSKKLYGDFYLLVIGYLLCMEMMS